MGSRAGKTGFRAEIKFSSSADAEAAYVALNPEIGTARRFRAQLRREGQILILEVDADDLSALRAALNSYLRWISMIEKLQKLINTS